MVLQHAFNTVCLTSEEPVSTPSQIPSTANRIILFDFFYGITLRHTSTFKRVLAAPLETYLQP